MSSPQTGLPVDPTAALDALRRECRTVILATVDAEAHPDASYAPFALEDGPAGALLLIVSGLARHTANLLGSRRASAMLIQDEAGAGQVFARRRATFACRVEAIARDTARWSAGIEALQARHGAVIGLVRDLGDFQLLRLVPEAGTLVLGFGKAFRLTGPGCRTIEPVGPK